jgi:hypothetical protein
MSHSDDRAAEILSGDTAARVLARAAELDVAVRQGTSVAQLRAAAQEVGIAPSAFDSALREIVAADAPLAGNNRVPWWVRVCLIGITDRRAAMVFYWFFALVLILAPLGTALLPGSTPRSIRLLAPLLVSGWAFFSLWSTSRAVRWLDRNGWDRLP